MLASPANRKQNFYVMKGSVLILASFAIGVFVGLYQLFPVALDSDEYAIYALAGLLFLLGVSISYDKTILNTLRKSKPVILLVPLGTVLGTYLGIMLITPLFSHYSISDMLAVGSGFGYYSISSIIITKYKGAELGTIALAVNIIRELMTLVIAPLLVTYCGKLAPIASGGATSMDTTLPIITRTSGTEFVFIAMFHGLMLDMSIPFLVTFFCQL